MFVYAVRRIFYSLLIMAGVLIVTFVLFRVAAGDPASTVLGKNPSPREVEDMRDRLGSDKPMFWGRLKKTQIYTSCEFSAGRTNFPGVTFSGSILPGKNGVLLQNGAAMQLKRHFEQDVKEGKPLGITLQICCDSPLEVEGRLVSPVKGKIECTFEQAPPVLSVRVREGQKAEIGSVEVFKPSNGPFDTQIAAALEELVTFTSTFPYVSFFNFGVTLQTREPIRAKLWKGMFPSLAVMLPVFFGELFFGIIFAMISCAFRGRAADRVIMILSVAGMSISYLVLIIAGQWFLAYYLNLFPVWGWGSPKYILLPVIIGIISGTGGGVRFYRTVFLDEINREYLRTAASKGVSPMNVYFRHLLKNALIPIITRASTLLPFLFTGSLLLETFFGIPGLGYEGIKALNDADLQMVKALVLLSAFLFVAINLVSDLAYAWADPRIRLNAKK